MLAQFIAEKRGHKAVVKMEKEDGIITDDIEDKLDIFTRYYSTLYSSSVVGEGVD